jgi:hypothetical protein
MSESDEDVTTTTRNKMANKRSDGSSIVTTARDEIAEQVGKKSTEIGEQVASAAETVRSLGERFREQERPGVAKLTDGVADRVDGIAGYLSSCSPEQIGADIRELATREPIAFAGACFAMGLFAARVVKAATSSAGGQSTSTAAGTSPDGVSEEPANRPSGTSNGRSPRATTGASASKPRTAGSTSSRGS